MHGGSATLSETKYYNYYNEINLADVDWGDGGTFEYTIEFTDISGKTVRASAFFNLPDEENLIYIVTIPENYKLNCYSSATAKTPSTYISAKSSSYQIRCTDTRRVNGQVRYFFISGDGKSLWFEFTRLMTVTATW